MRIGEGGLDGPDCTRVSSVGRFFRCRLTGGELAISNGTRHPNSLGLSRVGGFTVISSLPYPRPRRFSGWRRDCGAVEAACGQSVCGDAPARRARANLQKSWPMQNWWLHACTPDPPAAPRFWDRACSICGKVGHLQAMCRQADAGAWPVHAPKASADTCRCCGKAGARQRSGAQQLCLQGRQRHTATHVGMSRMICDACVRESGLVMSAFRLCFCQPRLALGHRRLETGVSACGPARPHAAAQRSSTPSTWAWRRHQMRPCHAGPRGPIGRSHPAIEFWCGHAIAATSQSKRVSGVVSCMCLWSRGHRALRDCAWVRSLFGGSVSEQAW